MRLRSVSRWTPIIAAFGVLAALFAIQLAREARAPITEVTQAAGIPDDLAALLVDQFPLDECISAPSASRLLRTALDRLGYHGWSVEVDSSVDGNPCVTWSVSATDERIRVIAALHPEVRAAIQEVSDQLLIRCLGKDDASAYVAATLSAHGVIRPAVRTDGPLGIPVNNADEVLQHIEEGCWVYSGTGWIGSQPVFYVGGN